MSCFFSELIWLAADELQKKSRSLGEAVIYSFESELCFWAQEVPKKCLSAAEYCGCLVPLGASAFNGVQEIRKLVPKCELLGLCLSERQMRAMPREQLLCAEIRVGEGAEEVCVVILANTMSEVASAKPSICISNCLGN